MAAAAGGALLHFVVCLLCWPKPAKPPPAPLLPLLASLPAAHTCGKLSCWPAVACRHGVAHNPAGTGLVVHRDIVSGKAGPEDFPAAAAAASGKQAAKRQKTAKQQQQQAQQPFDPSQVCRQAPSSAGPLACCCAVLLS